MTGGRALQPSCAHSPHPSLHAHPRPTAPCRRGGALNGAAPATPPGSASPIAPGSAAPGGRPADAGGASNPFFATGTSGGGAGGSTLGSSGGSSPSLNALRASSSGAPAPAPTAAGGGAGSVQLQSIQPVRAAAAAAGAGGTPVASAAAAGFTVSAYSTGVASSSAQPQHLGYEVAHYQPPPGIDVIVSDELPDAGTGGTAAALAKTAIVVLRDVKAWLRLPTHANGASVRVPGLLSASTYSLTFTPSASPSGSGGVHPSLRHLPRSFFTVPVASIRRVERSNPSSSSGGSGSSSSVGTSSAASQAGLYLLDLHAKDARTLHLGFGEEATADVMAGHIKRLAFPAELRLLQAYAEPPPKVAPTAPDGSPAPPDPATDFFGGGGHVAVTASGAYPAPVPVPAPTLAPFPGWDAYVPMRELARTGVLAARHRVSGEPLWRVADINREYDYAPTYPAVLVLPARASDAMMAAVAPFRSKARVPALTWMHPVTGATMWRCSQPRVGMSNATNASDEALLGMIREASRDPRQPLLIVDCRPHANALANKAGGWGYESYMGCNLIFCGMNNIHALRDSYR